MNWKVIYHREVTSDLESLGRAEAARVMKVIDERIRSQHLRKNGQGHLEADLTISYSNRFF